MDLVKLGSQTAKNGFKNEKDIADKFNQWKKGKEAKIWLSVMGYDLEKIDYVKATVLSGYKTDVQVQVTVKLKSAIDVENLQIKLVSHASGFNQIDKRWIDKYAEMWEIPNDIIFLLKQYTGENKPKIKHSRDTRRTFADEFSKKNQNKLISWLESKKSLIVNDILKGRGKFAAEWILVAQKIDKSSKWVLKPMNYAINYFGNGKVVITKKGTIRVGEITMQRKGGDGGRTTARMLQFKINPAKLFET